MEIVNFFFELARQELTVKSFHYGRNRGKGAGNELMPLIWLDDPILYGGNTQSTPANTTGDYTVNLDILDIPDSTKSIATVQGQCQLIGLALITKIQSIKPSVFSLVRWNAVTLSEYTDNNAAGWRFTLILTRAIPINICAQYFDSTKQFTDVKELADFTVDNPEGCAVFNDKPGLPKFNLTQ